MFFFNLSLLIFLFQTNLLIFPSLSLNVQAMVGNSIFESHDFEPKIVMKCGYYNQYLDRTGVWLSDPKGKCTDNYTAVTEYCKSIYPNMNISNVMPLADPIYVDNWCAPNEIKCDKSFKVYPIRCLETKFQSEALLVPEGCVFDHVHSNNLCIDQSYWYKVAIEACDKKFQTPSADLDKKPFTATTTSLRSHSMLLPCGIASFSGVEFVCCKPSSIDPTSPEPRPLSPKEPSIGNSHSSFTVVNLTRTITDKINSTTSTTSPADLTSSSLTSLPEVKSDSSYADDVIKSNQIDGLNSRDILDDVTLTTPTLSTSDEDLIKSYYATFDKDMEHDRYVKVKDWMKDKRRKTIISLMKQWSISKKHYNEIRAKDAYMAQTYKDKVSKTFQDTIKALESEEKAQKRQLSAIHEQRVTNLLNDKKRRFMFKFLRELEKPYPSTELLKVSLENLLRSEERDKMHVIHYYERLLNSDPAAAGRVRTLVARHVADVERRMNRSLDMLERRLNATAYAKIRNEIDTFIQTIKTRNGDFIELTRSIVSDNNDVEEHTTTPTNTISTDSTTITMTVANLVNIKNESSHNIYHSLITGSPLKEGTTIDDDDDKSSYDDDEDEEADDDEDDETDDDHEEADDNINGGGVGNPISQNYNSINNTRLDNSYEGRGKILLPYPYINEPRNLSNEPRFEALVMQSGGDKFHHGSSKNLLRHSSNSFGLGVALLGLAAATLVIGAVVLFRKRISSTNRKSFQTNKEESLYGNGNYFCTGIRSRKASSRNQLFKKDLPRHTNAKYEKVVGDNVSTQVQVDTESLTDRHLSNMQVNGYENPTYRYFEKNRF